MTESEAITYQYELDLTVESPQIDPRIAHTLNLQIDEYGQVLESVAVAYPRIGRHEEAGLPEGTEALIEQVQQERHLVYAANRFTNDLIGDESAPDISPDTYRLRLPCEVKTYELTGIAPRNGLYFSLVDLRAENIETAVPEIDYQVTPNRILPQKRRVEQVRILYFREDLQGPLAWGQLSGLGLPYETYKLALTDDLLEAIFRSDQLTPDVREGLRDSRLSGYLSGDALAERFRDLDRSGQYWVRSGIAGFAEDAAAHFYLPERYTNPFGETTTTLTYDDRDFYIALSEDLVGNVTRVNQFDFRVMAPVEMQDISNNRSEVYFDVLGMPTAMAVLGKGTEGDTLSGINDALGNPVLEELTAFFNGETYDEAQARRWLGGATARYVYHFGETIQAEGAETVTIWGAQPAATCIIMREQHQNSGSPLQVGFEYSDGMGSVLVQKVQAEPEREGESLRWIANGKTILNNKGNPVKQYEPYFSPGGHRFEEPIEVGVTAVLYYDAAGRQVRAEMPDGTYSRVAFSPWFMAAWDASDTVGEPNNAWYRRYNRGSDAERRAARLALLHADTPAVTHLDSLGREVVAVAHNKWERGETVTEEKYVTYTKLDIESKPLWIRDARGNRVMEYITQPGAMTEFVPCYDIAGNLLFQHSMDAGNRWMLMDSTGQPFYAWDENERVIEDGSLVPEQRRFHTLYDALRRPVEQQLRVDDGSPQVVERFIYGDEPGLFSDRPIDEIPEAQERNLRGQVYQHYDPSGLMTNQRFDFKGNLLEATRQLTQTYDRPIIDWTVELPATETFTQRTAYDALNRMVRQENWHRADRTDRPPAIYVPQYNQQGVLKSEKSTVRRQETDAIEEIIYNAKGQRLSIEYGNGTTTTYTYDLETFRLTHLVTIPTGGSKTFQDLYYTYDPVGNITEIRDDAYEPVFFRNQQVEPRSRYVYDALYRLIEATGREQYSLIGAPPQKSPSALEVKFPIDSPTSPNALRNYTQRYGYDSVGNIEKMQHVADRGSWTRNYAYATDSNRLLRTWKGDDTVNSVEYGYDTHGSMLNLNRVPNEYRLRWDYRDMIYTANLGGGGRAFYNYDADKQRTRKRIEHNGARVEERLYLGGMELYRRWENNNLAEEIETHHLFADDQRILIVEDVLETNNDADLPTGALYRYQYSNHLGSVGLELTHNSDPSQAAEVISYEEYHPYGTTAYSAKNAEIKSVAKQYQYTGMERDEETGLSYHMARYYLPWLGRWNSSDSSLEDEFNLYNYAQSNPISLKDTNGNNTELIELIQGIESGLSELSEIENLVLERRQEIRRLEELIGDQTRGYGPVADRLRRTIGVHTREINTLSRQSGAITERIARIAKNPLLDDVGEAIRQLGRTSGPYRNSGARAAATLSRNATTIRQLRQSLTGTTAAGRASMFSRFFGRLFGQGRQGGGGGGASFHSGGSGSGSRLGRLLGGIGIIAALASILLSEPEDRVETAIDVGIGFLGFVGAFISASSHSNAGGQRVELIDALSIEAAYSSANSDISSAERERLLDYVESLRSEYQALRPDLSVREVRSYVDNKIADEIRSGGSLNDISLLELD